MQQTPDAPASTQHVHTPTGMVQIRKPFVLAFLGLAVFLSAVSVLLIRQNRDLREWLQAVRNQLELQPGSFMPPVSGKDPQGSPLVIGYGRDRNEGKKKTVVLVFSPQCHICDENWPNWQRVLRTAEKEGARVVGVNLAPTLPQDYLDQHGLAGYPVIAQVDASSILAYRFRYTPQTIVVDANAQVQGVWTGPVNG